MKILTTIHENMKEKSKKPSQIGALTLAKDFELAFVEPRFSDVTLRLGDKDFPAHKVILANRSKVFEAMFNSDMKENQENIVELVEMNLSTAQDMLKYIYTGSVQVVDMDRAINLYTVADRYDLQELKEWCKAFMLEHITSDYVCDVALIADLHNEEDLAKVAKCVLKKNVKSILNSEKWKSFAKDNQVLYSTMIESVVLD
ncbi:speckle-type POZ protein-like [Uloborus diversus]|uniref:speckle-type POZ protein-like n=1 Tax=Uloborus diversus TaxID=327109 RepID=UPI002409E67A|nr:speckle-type POZ protein-like [Uloborus diversus]